MKKHLGRRVFPSCPPSSCLAQGPELEPRTKSPTSPALP